MTPQIYPGLSQPKSQLFFDIQGLIVKNGGRLRLADIIESENTKMNFRRPVRRMRIIDYTAKEIEFIINNYCKITSLDISFKLNKPLRGVRAKINRLQKLGILDFKTKH